jgi:GNAT superfamily N-acetyltransferase
MGTNVRIERARPEHLPMIGAMCKKLVNHLRDQGHDAQFLWDNERLEDDLFGFKPCIEAFIAFVDEIPVGYTIATTSYDVETWRREYELLDVYVDRDARGTGVAKMLIDRNHKNAASIGAHQMSGYIYRGNPVMSRFCEKYGFKLSDNYISIKMSVDSQTLLKAPE